MEGGEKLPELVLGGGFVREEGIFILEHSAEKNFSDHPNFYQPRSYGSVQFSFFKP